MVRNLFSVVCLVVLASFFGCSGGSKQNLDAPDSAEASASSNIFYGEGTAPSTHYQGDRKEAQEKVDAQTSAKKNQSSGSVNPLGLPGWLAALILLFAIYSLWKGRDELKKNHFGSAMLWGIVGTGVVVLITGLSGLHLHGWDAAKVLPFLLVGTWYFTKATESTLDDKIFKWIGRIIPMFAVGIWAVARLISAVEWLLPDNIEENCILHPTWWGMWMIFLFWGEAIMAGTFFKKRAILKWGSCIILGIVLLIIS